MPREESAESSVLSGASSIMAIGVGEAFGVAEGVAVLPESALVSSGGGIIGVSPFASWLLVSAVAATQLV